MCCFLAGCLEDSSPGRGWRTEGARLLGLPEGGVVTRWSPQTPPTGVVEPGGVTVETWVPSVWDTPETCRFVTATHGLGRQVGEVRVTSCGGPEPNTETRVIFLLPDPDEVVQEVAPMDHTNLWAVSRENLWSIRLDTGEVFPRSVPVPRSDWRGAWRVPGPELRLLDSGGGLHTVVSGIHRDLGRVTLPDGATVHGDGTWHPALGRSLILVEHPLRGVSVWVLEEGDTGPATPLPESRNLPGDVSGLAVSDGGWLWVTGTTWVLRVNPFTGEVDQSWRTGHTGPMAGSVVVPDLASGDAGV